MEKSKELLKPLAERMRPNRLEDYIGQEKLISENGVISLFLKQKNCPSIIFWGNPGVGKTTLAYLIAAELDLPFFSISAISAGVKDIREIIEKSIELGRVLLFIDEIHRFNKSQQDSLLKAVEEGRILLIGATTENPSFEVNRALMSRCKTYVLEELSSDSLKKIALSALEKDVSLNKRTIEIIEWDALLRLSGGDARKLLGMIELVCQSSSQEELTITNDLIHSLVQSTSAQYDKNGEFHYDIISAFIKSMRGSDPNAAVYWMTRMIDSGEDPKFIARRMIIFASEDIGMANPNALLLANTCFDAVSKIGYPECSIILSHTAVYLATSIKSNASYMALKSAQKLIRETGDLPVPMHLRNAPTKLMKELDYGKDYQYAHNYDGNFIEQEFLPTKIRDAKLYEPNNNPRENE
ncbi:MAG: replication-associated recombination protein A, partial [Chitinophagales bacterium]